jgi:branched-chain amino acid transport system ATP-binding protein
VCGCLLGRNGAGKSTVMRSIMGFLHPSAGDIRFDNGSLIGKPPDRVARTGIGYVPEDRGIFPHLSVEENLRVTRRCGPWPMDLAAVYELFPLLAERRRQASGTLSGGEQQLLSIGRALMGGPSLLLLDEPSEGLAPLVIRSLGNDIRRLREAGMTILLAEQNMEFARSVSDMVFVLDRGQICFQGTFDELERDAELKQRHLLVGHVKSRVA